MCQIVWSTVLGGPQKATCNFRVLRCVPIAKSAELLLPLLQDIAGIDAFATGTALALRLLRPLVLLGAVHLFQFGYSVGSLQASHSLA